MANQLIYEHRFGKSYDSKLAIIDFENHQGEKPQGVNWNKPIMPLGPDGNKWERTGIDGEGQRYLEVDTLEDRRNTFERITRIFRVD